MDREQAIAEVRTSWRSLYTADKKGGIVCPLCGSGSGPKGSGITGDSNHGKPNSLKCWSCNFTGDVIDLIQQERSIDFNEALQYAADELGIIIDAHNSAEQAKRDFADDNRSSDPKEATRATEGATEGIADYAAYYEECRQNLNTPAAISYLTARGISIETATKYGIGYDAKWISPTVKKNQQAKGSKWLPEPTARIIMPVSNNHYIARAISPAITDYAKMNETGGGNVEIFNSRALYHNNEAVFITEGMFDALSIIEAGAAAASLNSTSNAEKLIKQLEQKPTAATLVLCLDNDEPGKQAANTLKEGLTRLNICYVSADICGEYNDPNEALTGNKEEFITAIRNAEAQTAARPDNTSAYIDNLMQVDIAKFRAEIKTGFSDLDKESGGLYPGLYVLAATSSLGKTTFALQLADNLATSGQEVIFFSMEQSRLEMVSKSLSRISFQLYNSQPPKEWEKRKIKQPATSLEIRQGKYDDLTRLAAAEYKERVADRVSIIEGNFNCDISYIGEYIGRYIKKNGSRPIVFIDYLQILQPTEDNKRTTTKDIVDFAMRDLKRISREHSITIFVVCSVNRANYLMPIDFESLKESGGIEYTADVVWGLQLECLNEDLFSQDKKIKEKRQRIKAAKAEHPRKIQLQCLKNRYGKPNYSSLFDYFSSFDYFRQDLAADFKDKDDDFLAGANKEKRI